MLKNMQNDTFALKTRSLGVQASNRCWKTSLPVRDQQCVEHQFPSGLELCAFVTLSHKTTLYSVGDYAPPDSVASSASDKIKSCYEMLSRWPEEGGIDEKNNEDPLNMLDDIGRRKVGTFLLDSELGAAGEYSGIDSDRTSDPEAFLRASPGALRFIGSLTKLLATCWGESTRVSNVSQFIKALSDSIVAIKIGLTIGTRPMSRLVGLLPYFNQHRRHISYHREYSVQEFHRTSPYVVSPSWFISFRGKRNEKLFFRMSNHTIHYSSFPDVHDKLNLRIGADKREIFTIVLPTC